MATAPYGVRLLVGAATMAVEETIRLPKTILMYPMTLASTAAHVVMRFQQNVAELVIKGDSTLEHIFPPKDEQPEWATFDEDVPDDDDADGAPEVLGTERRAEGRFALYSSPDAADTPAPAKQPTGKQAAAAPEVAEELGYETLTLAQLRARLQSLDVDELEALLANRITRATAK